MKIILTRLAAFTAIALAPLIGLSQTYDTNGDYVQTFVGSGFSGLVNGIGTDTMFDNPSFVVSDSYSNLYVWDSGNEVIREIIPNGTVSTFAGGGTEFDSGYGTNAELPTFGGMTIDHSGALWMAANPFDSGGGIGYLIRVGSNGYVSSTNVLHFTYSINGGFELVSGMCVDSQNNIYYTDFLGNRIYQYNPSSGATEIFAGSGNSGYTDGNGIFTDFNEPATLACDEANNIYVWDSGNRLIRKIDQNQNVTTFAGNYYSTSTSNADGIGTNAVFYFSGNLNPYFNYIPQMCCDNDGNLYLVCRDCIRKISATSNVVTMAGSFTQTGYTNGAGNQALFNQADGICMAGGTIYVADSSNQRIRDITFNPQPQVVSGANLGIGTFLGVTITGIVGRAYEIQSSPNMTTWTTEATILLTSSPYLWIDQNQITGNKFYRALLMP
jgi:NHL repeat